MSNRPTASPTVLALYGGIVVLQPSPVHFTVTTARRRDGSLRIRVTRDAVQ